MKYLPYRLYLLILFLFFPLSNIFAQEIDLINIQLLEKDSGEPVVYANIINQSHSKATISDRDGYFSLYRLSDTDSISISYIGFSTLTIPVAQLSNSKVLYMEESTEMLSSVILSDDQSWLYDVVISCKKTSHRKERTAKTYYELKSHINDHQLELIESYHNGKYKGYDIQELGLKNGKIALASINNRYYISTATSAIIQSHKLLKQNEHFPLNPLELGKSKLQKYYKLDLVSVFEDSKNRSVYQIDFTPKSQQKILFEGTLWINKHTRQLLKIELKSSNNEIFPFAPIFHTDKLSDVDMKMIRSYQEIDGEMYLQTVQFDYELHYSSKIREKSHYNYTISTTALIQAYNFDEQFELPYFNFGFYQHEDYRKIGASPHNDFFWEHRDEFKKADHKKINEKFIQKNAGLTNQALFYKNDYFDKGFFQYTYKPWSEKRLLIRPVSDDPVNYDDYKGVMPSDRYNLEAQIYLDINEHADSLHILSQTIFDPYKSYYRFPMTNVGMAFINIYFDLVEIHRRELIREINQSDKKIPTVRNLYNLKMAKLKEKSQLYFKEVDRGTNDKALKKWSEIVYNKINIDNYRTFGLHIKPADNEIK